MPQCQFVVFCCFCISEKLYMKYSRNWTKQKPNLLFFSDTKTESKAETEEGAEVATPCLGAGHLLAAPRGGVGPSGAHRPHHSAYKLPPDTKTLNESASVHEKFHSSAAIEDKFRGTEVSVPAPCRDREVPPDSSPSMLLPSSMKRE